MQTQKFEIPNSNRHLLRGIKHIPENESGKAVLLLHGFTGYKEEAHLVTLAESLQAAGYTAVRFDASGFGESEGSISDYTFTQYLKDVETVYRWLHDDLEQKPTMHVVGTSMGGLIGLFFAISHADIDKLCMVTAPSKLGRSGELAEVLEDWEASGEYLKTSSKFGEVNIPWSFYEDVRNYDAFDVLDDLQSQLLVIAGGSDKVVPAKEVLSVYDAAPEPKSKLLIDDMTHDYKNYPVVLDAVNKEITRFLLG